MVGSTIKSPFSFRYEVLMFLYNGTVPTQNQTGVHCFVQHSVPLKRILGVKRTNAKC